MSKKYEVMFIVNVADEEVIRSAVEVVKATIAKIGGTIDKEDEWGKRQLAYEVKHQREGYYVVIDFTAEPSEIKELDRVIKIHEEIIRHIIVKLDD
jgi:small subunit ribosomal protein S6